MTELDDLDLRILDTLQRDAAQTNLRLAEQVHASPATCLRRVRRMTNAGIIQKQVALLDPAAVGQPLTAIVEVSLDIQTSEACEQFEQTVLAEAAISQCYRVSNGPDFILMAHLADMAAYHALARRQFNASSNIRNVRVFFAIHRVKFDPALPLRKEVFQKGV